MKRFWGVSIENIPIPYLKLEKLGFLIRYRVFLMVMVRGRSRFRPMGGIGRYALWQAISL